MIRPGLPRRVLEAEHLCYPAALERPRLRGSDVAGGRVTGAGRRLILHPSLAEA